MYSSPGNSPISLDRNDVADAPPADEILPFKDLLSKDSLPMGSPISAAELVRRALLPVALVARLNICGIRARDIDDVEPSAGWICWKDSNSAKRAFKLRRNSSALEELRSRTVGKDSPNKR